MTQIVIPQWLALDREVRHKIAEIFNLPQTGSTEVIDTTVMCDGYSHEDLKNLTSVRIAEYLGVLDVKPNEEDLHALFEQLAVKVGADLDAQAKAVESFAGNLGGATEQPAETFPHTVNANDMAENPELAQHDVKVGDEVQIPVVDEIVMPPAPEIPNQMTEAPTETFQPSQPPIEQDNTKAYKPEPTQVVE